MHTTDNGLYSTAIDAETGRPYCGPSSHGKMLATCPNCDHAHEVGAAAALGAAGGKKLKRKITPLQQATMQAVRLTKINGQWGVEYDWCI